MQNNQEVKIDIHPHISEWNEPLEKVIKNIGESAQAYKFMHYSTARYYNRMYNILMYLSLIITPIPSILGAIDVAVNPSTSLFSIPIIILSGISTLIIAIIKFSKPNEKSDQHKLTTTKYSSIEQNTRNQLGLYREDRASPKLYFEWISKSYDDLFRSSPLLSNRVYREYYKKNKKKGGVISLKSYDPFITVEKGYKDKISKAVSDNEEISVNLELRESPREESQENSETEPRRNVYTPISDYNQYSDSQMKYEMARFIGF